ncbi:hypothetical protein BpHYR1_005360 [Brachionus plicatilis]|uniref:Uncharacterized protein n=1 Tax=Brachionus plicatilis TaxID=10195 RepID=A0A3M7R4S3_BRAPC|nr:hypothetical protein BpHYR1_005360 [Brachionus plicatilis]
MFTIITFVEFFLSFSPANPNNALTESLIRPLARLFTKKDGYEVYFGYYEFCAPKVRPMEDFQIVTKRRLLLSYP